MKRLIFKKEDLSQLPIPEEGYVTLGISENGQLQTISDSGTISSIVGGGGDSLYTADGTITAGRVATITDTLTFAGGTVSMSNQRIVSVLDPVNNQDVSTKFYTDSKDIQVFSGTSSNSLNVRKKYRVKGYLEAVDNNAEGETEIQLKSDAVKNTEINRFGENDNGDIDLKIGQNKLLTGDSNGFAISLTFSSEGILGLDENNDIKEFQVVEIYNILRENAITGNKQLALVDINGTSSNIKAKFEISTIAVQNTTANAVTINVGSTALGTNVVNAFALGASETKKLPLGTTFFSTTLGQNLFISSGGWNSASINIHVTISKIWQ